MSLARKYNILSLLILIVLSHISFGQSKQSLYLFHWNPFKQIQPQIPTSKRTCKTRIDAGLLFGFYKNDPHYTNTTQSKGGYMLGAREEIPVLRQAAILIGFDFYKEGLTFNSYYFAKGYSFLYDGNEIYNHTISLDEFQFPVEYRFSFTPETKNIRTFYALFGWVYRLIIYDNALVINTQNGRFVYEGQDNLNYKYSLFSNQGSTVMELGLGYQRNTLKNNNAFFMEINFRYGISPLVYTGNGMGSNNIVFTMNTLSIKVGLKL